MSTPLYFLLNFFLDLGILCIILSIRGCTAHPVATQQAIFSTLTGDCRLEAQTAGTDCDQDALVLYVDQIGEGACHTGRSGCFYRRVDTPEATLSFTEEGRRFDPDAVYGKK